MKYCLERKSLELCNEELESEHEKLRKVLGPVALTSLGIGTIIGTGIFVLVGVAAHDTAGPAIVVSFIVAGIACMFAALCYAEFASMTPVAGSAYTYAYATLGEVFAWIIGWDLILEYTVASAAVAVGWSGYFQNFLSSTFGIHIPAALAGAPFDMDPATGSLNLTGNWVDLPALLISSILTIIIVMGIKESAWVNSLIVIIKTTVVLFVIAIGIFYVVPSNWIPFAPFGWTGLSLFGDAIVIGGTSDSGKPLGMLAGAGIIFFAYIGFDAVSTHAEEARNPQRDVPIGILASLVICTFLFIGVAGVVTGIVKYDELNVKAPVADAFARTGIPYAETLISIGAIAGLTSVMMVLMLSQSRVILAMARDGLLPRGFFGAVHPKFRTPWKTSILTGVCVGILSGVLPLRTLFELVNIGTLFAFVVVCLAVLIMRYKRPEFPRPFRCPWVPFVPIMGAIMCLMLMLALPPENWTRLFFWLAGGMFIYVFYGRTRSILAQERAGTLVRPPATPPTS